MGNLLKQNKLLLLCRTTKLKMKFFFIVLLIYISISCVIYTKPERILGHPCFSDRYLGEDLERFKLEDILLSERRPTKGKSIFFHETTCSKTGKLLLNARQTCAIESVASLNPNLDIFVLFASPTALTEDSLPIKEILSSYSNIYLRNVNLWRYTEGTRTAYYNWLKDGQLFQSKYLSNNVADFIRLVTLWHWGGTHLDFDIILKKTLENIKPNFVGVEGNGFVASGVLNLDHEGFGHNLADLFLRNFTQNFSSEIWGVNGPQLLTRVLKDVCKVQVPKILKSIIAEEIFIFNRCKDFKFFSRKAFYAIKFNDWIDFFEEQSLQKTLNLTEQSIAIHVWNLLSKNHSIEVGSKVAYGVYAEKYCPKSYKLSGKYF